MRVAFLVAGLCLSIPASAALSAEISGQDEPRFQTALTAWLNEDDQTSLPELAALAAEDNRAAQVLLGLVDRAPPLQGPWLANLPRSERIALIRAPGGLSGRSWMLAAAEDTPLAQLWVMQPTPEANLDTGRRFAAMGEVRAARITLNELSRRQFRDFAALADDPAYPPDMRYLVWREWAADPVKRADVEAEIAALHAGDPQAIRFDGRQVAPGDIEAWLAQSSLAEPLRAACEVLCPATLTECTVAAFDLLGGGDGVVDSHNGLAAFGTPSETLIPPGRWTDSARARSALLRQSNLRFQTATSAYEQATARDACLSEAIAADAARFRQ